MEIIMANATESLTHDHVFLGRDHERNEKKVWLVIALTATMMVAEIVAGSLFGSMALMADGWHMSTHAGAMLISALAYMYARRNAKNPRFTFGTGKLGDLAGFASAIVLALVALFIAWESLVRLANPVAIDFDQAIFVAVIGLAVNLASAWLLRDDHDHAHGGHHGHHGGHAHADHHGAHAHSGDQGKAEDHNLRAAYLHVLADALTSVLAIAALILGRIYGWNALDPIMGIVGGVVIARWSWGLIGATSRVLLDAEPGAADLADEIRRVMETPDDTVLDLHVWQVGPGHYATIVSVATTTALTPASYKQKLKAIPGLSHVTVEVTPLAA
jgi:cation diffusion facilitator family transporter